MNQQNENYSATTTPLSFFPGSDKKRWFKIESPIEDFKGIKGCVNAAQEAVQTQKRNDSSQLSQKWQALERCLQDAFAIVSSIETDLPKPDSTGDDVSPNYHKDE